MLTKASTEEVKKSVNSLFPEKGESSTNKRNLEVEVEEEEEKKDNKGKEKDTSKKKKR